MVKDNIDGLNYNNTKPGRPILKILVAKNQGLATWVTEKWQIQFFFSFLLV